jgi:hypothetical protein
MAYNYNQKGVWRVVYKIAANDSQFVELNKQNWNEVVLEEKLKRSDFKEALAVINRVKGLK